LSGIIFLITIAKKKTNEAAYWQPHLFLVLKHRNDALFLFGYSQISAAIIHKIKCTCTHYLQLVSKYCVIKVCCVSLIWAFSAIGGIISFHCASLPQVVDFKPWQLPQLSLYNFCPSCSVASVAPGHLAAALSAF
jgi:hypothetical protein